MILHQFNPKTGLLKEPMGTLTAFRTLYGLQNTGVHHADILSQNETSWRRVLPGYYAVVGLISEDSIISYVGFQSWPNHKKINFNHNIRELGLVEIRVAPGEIMSLGELNFEMRKTGNGKLLPFLKLTPSPELENDVLQARPELQESFNSIHTSM
ncbi:hypothetical protein ACFL12_00255 [Pseudomonadota bacterium]